MEGGDGRYDLSGTGEDEKLIPMQGSTGTVRLLFGHISFRIACILKDQALGDLNRLYHVRVNAPHRDGYGKTERWYF